ncbi:integrase family protein, partial [Acidithiobacillus sp. GGI-221]
TISRILGHSSTKMTERYAHLQTDAQSIALERAFSENALNNALNKNRPWVGDITT